MKKQSPIQSNCSESQKNIQYSNKAPFQNQYTLKSQNNAQNNSFINQSGKQNAILIPMKKICFNHAQFEQPLFNICLKIFPSQNFFNIFITSSKSQYAVIIKKQNIRTQFIISDVIKNTLLIKGSGMINSYTLPILPNQLQEENIILHPFSLLDSLSQLKNTIYFQKKEKYNIDKRGKKKIKKDFENEVDNYQIIQKVRKIQTKKQRIRRKAERKASQRIEQMMEKHQNNNNQSQNQIALNPLPLTKIQQENQEIQDIIKQLAVQFKTPKKQKIQQGEKLKQKIQSLNIKQKQEIFLNIFKINKVQKSTQIKCPIYACNKNFASFANLSSHVNLKHPFLSKYGIQFTNEKILYSEKAINMALYLGKIYSKDISRIIKRIRWQKK